MGRRNSSGVDVAGGEGCAGNSIGRKGIEVQVAPACRFSKVAESNVRHDLLGVGGARQELLNGLRLGFGNGLFPKSDAGSVYEIDVGSRVRLCCNGRNSRRISSDKGFGFFAGSKGLGPLGQRDGSRALGSSSSGRCRSGGGGGEGTFGNGRGFGRGGTLTECAA